MCFLFSQLLYFESVNSFLVFPLDQTFPSSISIPVEKLSLIASLTNFIRSFLLVTPLKISLSISTNGLLSESYRIISRTPPETLFFSLFTALLSPAAPTASFHNVLSFSAYSFICIASLEITSFLMFPSLPNISLHALMILSVNSIIFALIFPKSPRFLSASSLIVSASVRTSSQPLATSSLLALLSVTSIFVPCSRFCLL